MGTEKSIRPRLLGLCILLLLACHVFLPSSLKAEEQPLKVVTLPLPPWGYIDHNQKPVGICYEWANAIAERMGRKINNRIVPMARLFKAIEYGHSDFSIMLRTPYSEKISIPVVKLDIPFRTIVWPRKGIQVNTLADLKNIQISMPRGLKVGGKFNEQKDLKIFYSADYAHSMEMFKAKRANAIVGTQQSLLYNALKAGLKPAEEFGQPFLLAELEGWVQASYDFVEREGIENLRKATTSLIEDGTFTRIYRKYQPLTLTAQSQPLQK